MLLKKLYVRRMAADLGISKIYTFGKMVGMRTSMSRKVFRLIVESMPTDIFRSSLVFEDNLIKVRTSTVLPVFLVLASVLYLRSSSHYATSLLI